MNHRLPQIFGAGLATAAAQSMRDAVVFHHNRVIDGNVGGPLIELTHGIPARLHHLGHKLVRPGDRSFGVIHELKLDDAPAEEKSR